MNDPKYDKLAFVTTLTYPVLGHSVCPILVFIFTCLIAANLHKQYIIRRNMATGQEDNQTVKEFKITAMLFVTACVFLIPRGFQVVVWFIKNYTSSVQIRRILSLVTGFLVTVSHSINFLVYFSFFDNFRKVFISWFSCGTETTQPETRVSSQNTELVSVSNQDVLVQISAGHLWTFGQGETHGSDKHDLRCWSTGFL